MHRGIDVMAPETPVAKLAQKMRDLDISAIPVGTEDALQGTGRIDRRGDEGSLSASRVNGA